MNKLIINYKNHKFKLDDYRLDTDGERLQLVAVYKREEFWAADLPTLKGLLSLVFDVELEQINKKK